ncbi:hypothetical protein HDU85_003693 [Gaertneriomyces sp. JEL0708]|nr:hypothetical protein HDU85_003693 [Gaertneriomyces sp. JEL0708]
MAMDQLEKTVICEGSGKAKCGLTNCEDAARKKEASFALRPDTMIETHAIGMDCVGSSSNFLKDYGSSMGLVAHDGHAACNMHVTSTACLFVDVGINKESLPLIANGKLQAGKKTKQGHFLSFDGTSVFHLERGATDVTKMEKRSHQECLEKICKRHAFKESFVYFCRDKWPNYCAMIKFHLVKCQVEIKVFFKNVVNRESPLLKQKHKGVWKTYDLKDEKLNAAAFDLIRQIFQHSSLVKGKRLYDDRTILAIVKILMKPETYAAILAAQGKFQRSMK